VAGRWWLVPWGIALVAVVIGACAALICGFWGVNQECHTWVNSHGYQLEYYDWWAKTGGCVAKTPGGDEIDHTINLAAKAKVWVWQFAIFALSTLPTVGMTIYTRRHPRF
jgi:hypothetical protein